MGTVLVVAEHLHGKFPKTTLVSIAAGKQMATHTGGTCIAAVLGQGVDALAGELAEYGVDVVAVDGAPFAHYLADAHTAAVAALVEQKGAEVVIAAATALGKDLLPRLAGQWSHLERLLPECVRDGARVLDAGTGTGGAIESLLRHASPGEVMGVDLSMGMLRMARRKIKDPRVKFDVQDITRLSYPDRGFDVALSTWTLETLPHPRQAVREFLRLIKDDGYVIYAFSSRPAAGLDRAYAALLERAYQGSLRWHLLGKDERPYHDCAHSSLTTFARGLATVVVLRKCCSVEAPDNPCLPGAVNGQRRG